MKSKKSNLILIFSIIFLIFILFLKVYFSPENIKPFGITILEVSSDSMNPIFNKGDIVIVKKQEAYEIGDIITYYLDENCLITHRIVEKYENGFITKGDDNNVKDKEMVELEQIIGKVIYVFN